MEKKKYFDLRTMIVLALLAAIGAVFKVLPSIDIPFMGVKISDISFMTIPIMLAGIYYGPLAGGIVGFVAETAGFFMAPTGDFNLAFSVVAALLGVIAGLFYLKSNRTSLWKTLLIVASTQIICSAMLNTLIIHWFYGVPFHVLIPPRGIGLLIKIPLFTLILMLLVERLRPVVGKHRKTTN